MTELYLKENPFESKKDESNDGATGMSSAAHDVEASVKASETLGLENPRNTENLWDPVLKSCDNPIDDTGASDGGKIDSVADFLKGIVPESKAMPDADTSVGQENLENVVIPES
ncbi:hypothetical protein A2U01_0060381, partial [Trifolium medium]|nr:hypothetical protein [Trifolium medium]